MDQEILNLLKNQKEIDNIPDKIKIKYNSTFFYENKDDLENDIIKEREIKKDLIFLIVHRNYIFSQIYKYPRTLIFILSEKNTFKVLLEKIKDNIRDYEKIILVSEKSYIIVIELNHVFIIKDKYIGCNLYIYNSTISKSKGDNYLEESKYFSIVKKEIRAIKKDFFDYIIDIESRNVNVDKKIQYINLEEINNKFIFYPFISPIDEKQMNRYIPHGEITKKRILNITGKIKSTNIKNLMKPKPLELLQNVKQKPSELLQNELNIQAWL